MADHIARKLLKNVVGFSDERRINDCMKEFVTTEWAEIDRQHAAGLLRGDLVLGARRAVCEQVIEEIANDPVLYRTAIAPDAYGLNMIDRIRQSAAPYDDENVDSHVSQQRSEDALKVVLGTRLGEDLRNGDIAPEKYNEAIIELGFVQPEPSSAEEVVSEPEEHAGDMSPAEFERFCAQRERETGSA